MTTSDPAAEALRLRSRRPPVVRLSRKMLIGLSAVAGLAVIGLAAYGLSVHRTPRAKTELYNVGGAQAPAKVRALPVDYRTRLGPPLPGDLGVPILAAGAPVPAIGATPQEIADNAAIADRQQSDQERESARTSRLFVSDEGPATTPAAAAKIAGGGVGGSVDPRATSPDRLSSPASPYVVQAGAVIPAALITGIRSDLPGQVVGQVTQNVYDGPTGRHLLIPQGARLVGSYESRIALGQRRVMLAWTRLILPDGRSLMLEKLPANDVQGYAGLEDEVDRHWSGLFGMAALSTLLGVGAELGASDDENDILRALRRGGVGTFNQAGQQAVGQGLSLAPTLTIRPGAPVRVMVTRDLVLQPYAREAP